jgi:hypothetical protein
MTCQEISGKDSTFGSPPTRIIFLLLINFLVSVYAREQAADSKSRKSRPGASVGPGLRRDGGVSVVALPKRNGGRVPAVLPANRLPDFAFHGSRRRAR